MTRTVYTFLLYLLLPFTPLKLLWRGRKQPEYLQHWCERYGFYSVLINKPVIWLHCVSVGETRAAAPLVKALLQQYPNHRVLLTHTTPTGRATSEQLFGDSISRVYLPYDVPFAVNRFLKHFKPAVGVLMETELWFNLIAGCKRQNIPLLLVNARLSEKSAIGYAKLGRLVNEGLQSLSAIAAQTQEDKTRLQSLGAHHLTVAGNLKFDVRPPQDAIQQGQHLRALLGTHRAVFLAASTREGEEAIILDALAAINVANLLTVIVPRHPQRFNEVEALLQQRGLTYQKRSNLLQAIDDKTNYILGDSMGELFTYYAACDLALIGGSLLPFGGQNLIEAAVMGRAILIGPHTFNFADVTKNGVQADAVIQVKDATELREKIEYLLNNKTICEQMGAAGLRFTQASTGATAKVMQLIAVHLNN
ncbi:MAG TPA: lipid IV(A) 3-deoxy-D-manno-octulosonic acid transferase [Methylotenera sp.]|nr:lipid IV(A) 3-deoxy-D-manno-octulosonic acid transferase [Methylotenera sp.]